MTVYFRANHETIKPFGRNEFGFSLTSANSGSQTGGNLQKYYHSQIQELRKRAAEAAKLITSMSILDDVSFPSLLTSTKTYMWNYFDFGSSYLGAAASNIDTIEIAEDVKYYLRGAVDYLHSAAKNFQATKNRLNEFYNDNLGSLSEEDKKNCTRLNDMLENLTRGYETLPGADYLSAKLKSEIKN